MWCKVGLILHLQESLVWLSVSLCWVETPSHPLGGVKVEQSESSLWIKQNLKNSYIHKVLLLKCSNKYHARRFGKFFRIVF